MFIRRSDTHSSFGRSLILKNSSLTDFNILFMVHYSRNKRKEPCLKIGFCKMDDNSLLRKLHNLL